MSIIRLSRPLKLMPLAGVSFLALATAGYAQSVPPEAFDLGTISLVADGKDNIEATGGTVITAEDLETLQPADVSELFSRESSVTVSGGGGPGKKVSVFGIEQSMLAVSVDGVPQVQTSWHHTGSNVIDPAFLRAVEVEAGAAAADSGFAAAAGALRYETVGAKDMLEPGQNVGGRAALSFGTNGRGTSATANTTGSTGSSWPTARRAGITRTARATRYWEPNPPRATSWPNSVTNSTTTALNWRWSVAATMPTA